MTLSLSRQAALFPRAFLNAAVRFNNNGGWVMSSHVAMSMMLALFPFVLFIVALAATLSQDIDVDNLIELVFGSWPDEIAAPITAEVRAVLSGANSQLLTVGGFLAIYFASNGVDAVRQAMTYAYRDDDPRSFWHTRLLCLMFVVLGGLVVLLAAAIGVALPLYFHLVSDAVPNQLLVWLSGEKVTTLFALLLLVFSVFACHFWLPGHRHTLVQIIPGVVLTVLLWALAGGGFSYYMAKFATYSATYAGLAGVMAALIFLYLMAAILVLGAEFNGALAKLRTEED